jgi:NAD(P)H-dependent flavin oxidoreductase YrpB (nitropropane dioxygenase family)
MKLLNSLFIGNREILPLIEGGKGVSASNGRSAGAWANAGGIGTFSGVNADSYDVNGSIIPQIYKGKTRTERHEELIQFGIDGGIAQAKIAHELAGGHGMINMNVLWEMGGAVPILHGVLSKVKGLVHGVTCGAGMPYKLGEIAKEYDVLFYPIVSSARAFNALWKRAYHKFSENLGAVVYEDPWLAGGHNGLSNAEDPTMPQSPYERVLALRKTLTEFGQSMIPIIMAGGVWWLKEWEDWIDNKELGPIAFQFGTRPLLTQESPISDAWKNRLLTLKQGDVYLNRFSPTGFYSSAVENDFLQELKGRTERQVSYAEKETDDMAVPFEYGPRKRVLFLKPEDHLKATQWVGLGFTELLKTPDDTIVFVTPEIAANILKDQLDCMGCLSACAFSNWLQTGEKTTGRKPDPRSFCIQKSLQSIAHGGDVDHNLMFAGHNAYRFAQDPFYNDGFVPTVKQLVERILTGY